MNGYQRWLLVAYAVVVAYICLWVPWTYGPNRYAASYNWVWHSPRGGRPDLARIGLRFTAATALGFAGWLALRSKEHPPG